MELVGKLLDGKNFNWRPGNGRQVKEEKQVVLSSILHQTVNDDCEGLVILSE